MSWNKQPSILPAGAAVGNVLVQASASALGWANRVQLLNRVDADTTVVNSTADTALAEGVIPFGTAGDLFIVEAFGDLANSSAAAVNLTWSLKAGDAANYAGATSVLAAAAFSVGVAAAPAVRSWAMRALVAMRTSSTAWIGAALDETNAGSTASVWPGLNTAGSFRGTNTVGLALDTRAQSIYLGAQLGTASPNASVTCRAVRVYKVPA